MVQKRKNPMQSQVDRIANDIERAWIRETGFKVLAPPGEPIVGNVIESAVKYMPPGTKIQAIFPCPCGVCQGIIIVTDATPPDRDSRRPEGRYCF